LCRRAVKLLASRRLPLSPPSREVWMSRFLFLVDEISIWVGKAFAWCIVVLTAAVCYEVFMRYVMGRPSAWGYDVAYMLYGALFFMAGAYALAQNAHVRVDIFYRKWSQRSQAILELILYAVFFFPGIVALVWAGYHFAALSWRINEHSMFTPGGPPLYPFKALIPLSGAVLALQGIAEVMRCGIAIRTGRWPERVRDVRELDQEIIEDPSRAATLIRSDELREGGR
jgi:TRAP-type mannitol/chloroaromatic compound transport system permease small subunit